MQELVNYCEWEWTQMNGIDGVRVVGPNGNCIFLPTTGVRDGSSLISDGYDGFCWSSTPDYGYVDDGVAYGLGFDDDNNYVAYHGRYFGLTIRPVSE